MVNLSFEGIPLFPSLRGASRKDLLQPNTISGRILPPPYTGSYTLPYGPCSLPDPFFGFGLFAMKLEVHFAIRASPRYSFKIKTGRTS